MINCTFTNNTVFATGIVQVSYANVLITGCTFSGSSSIEDTASVIYIVFAEESYHNVTISKTTFINNRLPRGATNGAVIYVFQRSPCSNHLAIASLTFDNPDTPHELTIVGNGLITFTPFNTCITPNVMTSPAAGSFTFITNSLGNVISSFCSTCALVYGGVSGYCDSMSKTINCANIASSTEPKVKCVSDCPTPLFNTGTSCEPACPIPSYVTLETRVCGDSFDCLIPNPSNRFCVKCEPNTYYNNESSTCVPASKCPVTAPLADAATGSCVAANECSVYTTFVKDNVCYSCPPLTYNNNGVCTPCSTDVLCTKCYTSVANWTSLTDILSNSVPQDVLCFRLSSPVTKPSSAPSFTIPRSLTIAHLSVQGDGVISSNRAFNTPFSSRVNWVDVTFQNFIVSGCNGAVHSITAGTTTFTNCRFLNISSSSLAGSIVAQSFATVVNFNKCTFSNNTSEEGGAVLVYQATSRFTDCVFSKNRAGRGGAVALEDGNNWFKNCSFINNSCSASSSCGGAVFVKTYNALPEYNNAFVRSTFSGNYCQKPVITSSVFSVVSPTTKILNLGLASVDFGGALNPIYVSMTGVGSVLNIYSFNTCWFQLYQRDKGVVNSYAAGTNATAGINNFCSTCINVFPNKEYCNLLSSTIDCMDAIISTEPTGTQCACPADFVNDNTTMTCVPQKKGNGDGSSDGSNNNVIGGGSNSENSSSGSSGNVNMASIYGPVVGIILVIAVVGIVIFRRRRRTQLESFDNLESNESHSVGLFKLPTSDSSSLSSNPELYSQLEMPKIKANEIRDIGKML